MQRVTRALLFISLLLILILASCNLPMGSSGAEPSATASLPTVEPGPPEPIDTPEQPTVTTTPEETTAEVVFEEPAAGALSQWIDASSVVFVPGGEFEMGRDETTLSDHSPAHTVTLSPFWIYQTEVTNSQYATCVELGACSSPSTQDNTWYTAEDYASAPVTGVTWAQAEAYCEWAQARLPTEAEWEKAARGTDAATYPWGEDVPTCSLANYEDCFNPARPATVRTYPDGASPYELADMAGNADEWVYDWYADDYYAESPASDPGGPASGEERVVRSGSFLSSNTELQSYLRSSQDPAETRSDLGFRCVLTGGINPPPTLPNCTTLSYEPLWPPSGAVQVQQDPPGFTPNLYCYYDNNDNLHTTATILLDPPDTSSLITSVTVSNGAIDCSPDAADPQKMNCSTSGLTPGETVAIKVCHAPAPAQALPEPTCPVFYHIDPATNLCTYSPPVAQCQAPDVSVPGYGCLPAPVNNECPTAYYSGTFNGSPVCIPVSGPKACKGGAACSAACPQGLVYNESSVCCEYPEDVTPTCPPGYTYNKTLGVCKHHITLVSLCTTINVQVPVCPTPVIPVQTGCLIRSISVTGAPILTCVYPCPVTVGNEGPCTP